VYEPKVTLSGEVKMKKVAVLSVLLCVVAGCNTSVNSDNQKREAIGCARNWKAQGYNFDPNSMTCRQMFLRVQTIQRAEYWKQKGYNLDPNSITIDEMDRKVKDIDRAKYWKKKGYDFNPYSMTAREMDRQVEELDEAERWKKRGYYYDPNTKTVYLSEKKWTKLESLAGIHGTSRFCPRYSVGHHVFHSDTHTTGFLDRWDSSDNLRHSPRTHSVLPNLPPLASNSSTSSLDLGERTKNRTYLLGERTKNGIYLGQWSVNKFDPHSISNPFGAGNRFNLNSINNEFGKYGSKFSSYSHRNPFATNTPKLYDSQGNYRGKLSSNPFDLDSISNPFGRYGNRFSPDSPDNPFGQGLSIFGEE